MFDNWPKVIAFIISSFFGIGSIHLSISCTDSVQEKCPGTVQELMVNLVDTLQNCSKTLPQ